MAYTERFSEDNEVLGHIPADSETTAVTSGWLLMENHHRAVALISVGDMVATATLDATLTQAQDSIGTGAKAITGKAITQLTQAGGDSNKVVMIELRSEELDVSNGFEYILLTITPAVAAVEFAAFVLGTVSRYKPVSTTNVEEIVD
jgi:hypothetical protein